MKGLEVIEELAKYHETFYLYDEQILLENIERLKKAFSGVRFLYSMKCNPNMHILRSVFSQGLGADAASPGEVQRAAMAGLRQEEIYYSAPGKTIEDIEQTINKAILIADSISELQRIETVWKKKEKLSVGIRINPNFSFDGNGGQPSKFGIDEEAVDVLLEEMPFQSIRIAGIHIHIQSQIIAWEKLAAYYRYIFSLAEKFHQAGCSLSYINLGSGIGIPYGNEQESVDIERLGRALRNEMERFLAKSPHTHIYIETGRYVAGPCGMYITKVADKKVSRGKTYLILKNTLNGFIRPSLAMLVGKYSKEEIPAGCEPLFTCRTPVTIQTLTSERQKERVTLMGNLCTSADVIAEDIELPVLEAGDLLLLSHAGSYGAVLSPMQFSFQQKPAEIFLTAEGTILYDSAE